VHGRVEHLQLRFQFQCSDAHWGPHKTNQCVPAILELGGKQNKLATQP
jgi:hypothetical protein